MSKNIGNLFQELYKQGQVPASKVLELNIKTFEKFSKNTKISDAFTKAKKPEEIFQAQTELAKQFQSEATNYIEEISKIYANSATDFASTLGEMAEVATNHKEK